MEISQLSVWNLQGKTLSVELSRDLLLFPDEETFSVCHRFLKAVFPEDPNLAFSLLDGFRSEFGSIYDAERKIFVFEFSKRRELENNDRRV